MRKISSQSTRAFAALCQSTITNTETPRVVPVIIRQNGSLLRKESGHPRTFYNSNVENGRVHVVLTVIAVCLQQGLPQEGYAGYDHVPAPVPVCRERAETEVGKERERMANMRIASVTLLTSRSTVLSRRGKMQPPQVREFDMRFANDRGNSTNMDRN